MKYFSTLFVALLWLSSCGDICIEDLAEDKNHGSITNQESDVENYEFKFYRNTSLQITEEEHYRSLRFAEGANLVFECRYTYEDNPDVADDEYSETIFFEVNPEVSQFTISDSELKDSKAMFGISCYCFDRSYYHIENGTIKGVKTGENEWEIAIEVAESTPKRDFTRKISGKFIAGDWGK